MSTTDEIARELAKLVRWEPGMRDAWGVFEARVLRVDPEKGIDVGDRDCDYRGCCRVEWYRPSELCPPDLTDDSTLDVLWGQLRRRFAACGWRAWQHDVDELLKRSPHELTVSEGEVHRDTTWDQCGDALTVLLAGYRRVVELEREQGNASE